MSERDNRSIVDNAIIDLCASFFQNFMITRSEADWAIFLEACERLSLPKKGEVVRRAANNIRTLKLAEPLNEYKSR